MELDTRHKTLADPCKPGTGRLARQANRRATSTVAIMAALWVLAGISVTGALSGQRLLSLAIFVLASMVLVLVARRPARATSTPAVAENMIDYRQVFVGNAGPMLIYDVNTLQILDANPAALDFFGWSEREMSTLTLESLWPAHLEQRLRQSVEEIRADARQFHLLSTPLRLRDGSCRQMEVRGNPIGYAGHEARLLIVIDRSAEALAEQHQKQALARLEEAHRIARIGTWELDPVTGLALFSDQVYQLLGQRPPASHRWRAHKELLVVTDEATAAAVDRTIDRLCTGLLPQANLLLPLLASGGRPIMVHLRAQCSFDENGQPASIACTLQDVTEQEASRRLLREREEQFRELVRVLPDGVIILAAGVVLYANATGAAQFGTSRELLLGTSINEMVEATELATLERLITDQGQRTSLGDGLTLRMRRTDGSSFSAGVAMADIRYGGRDCQLLLVRDLTESERNREALARSNRELQAMAGRLFSLQEDERRAISRDLHDDIGQSITAMKLSAHAAMEEQDAQRRNSDLRQIASLADGTILKLRNLSMLLRPPQLDALGLEAALRWHASMLFRSSQVELAMDIEPLAQRPVEAIEQACFRIAQESLTNVLRHARATHVTLTLEDDGDQLHLQVDDNGQGFDPDGPRGLGLIVMRERAQACGGTLKIRSVPGTGTRVDLYLPYQGALAPSPVTAGT